jgi:hypothetical protein
MSNGPLVQVINNFRNSILPNAEEVQYLSKDTQELVQRLFRQHLCVTAKVPAKAKEMA